MANSLNKVTLIGRLGKDPELRSTPMGSAVCSFTMATSENYKDKSGEWKEETEWHSVVAWNNLAERVAKILRKGSKVYIEGKLKTREYEKEGIKRYKTEIYALTMIPLDPKEKSEVSESGSGYSVDHDFSAVGSENEDVPF